MSLKTDLPPDQVDQGVILGFSSLQSSFSAAPQLKYALNFFFLCCPAASKPSFAELPHQAWLVRIYLKISFFSSFCTNKVPSQTRLLCQENTGIP